MAGPAVIGVVDISSADFVDPETGAAYWISEPVEGAPRPLGDGWVEVGYTTEDGVG